MNVPKLRFKEFKDEWITEKVGDSTKILMCKRIFSSDTSDSGEIPFYKIGTIGSKPDAFISRELFEQYKNKYNYPRTGEVLITCSGTVGKCVIFDGKDSYYQDSNIVWLDNPSKKIINDYLYYYVSNVDWSRLNSTTIVRIYGDNLRNLKIIYPSNQNEQEKITNTIKLLDKKIELQSKKIEDLKLFKKGLINSIGKNIEIEKIPLKNILAEQNHKTIKNNEYEILSSTSKGIYLQKDYFNKQAASDNNVGYKILKKNQLVLSPQNLWMGNININSKYNIGIVSPSYKIFDINNNIDIDFFDYWIKSPKALFEYKISSEQGASIVRRNLNMDLFYEIKVDIPKGNMQNKLGKIIKLLNLKIQYNENLLQKLQELKKGLMQNMFV